MAKPPWEWDEGDILTLISNRVQESVTLDYKACDALAKTDQRTKTELSKDVSAFANGGGGTIIYGVHEKDQLPTGLDKGYDTREISREWLEQVINSGIQRRIDGIRINPVQLTSSPGKVLYVVYIPQSTRAPHMAADNRFYKRFNFMSVPMEEYEVRDVGRRTEAPDLTIEMRLARVLARPVIEIGLYISNLAPEPATYAMVRIFVDISVEIIASEGLTSNANLEVVSQGDAQRRVQALYLAWAPPKLPIWEGEWLPLTGKLLSLRHPRGEETRVLGWQITSPKMNPKRGSYGLMERPDGTMLVPFT